MSLANLKKVPAGRVLGIDCSTKSLAYAVFHNREPLLCGEVFFTGATLYERLADAHKKVPALVKAGVLKAEYIAFEAAYLGPNPQTGISLAYVYGAAMGGLMDSGMKVVTVNPLQWQSYIGNPNLKKAEKEAIKIANPGKSASWYSNANREYRKQRTLTWAKGMFEIPTDSDNVGDAIGVAWYAAHHLTAPISV